MPAPTSSTEWASSISALSLVPTAVQTEKGWDTDDGTLLGVPEKPTLQYDNGWQKNVHEWINYIVDGIGEITLIPAGTIVPVMSNLTGSSTLPLTGGVTGGWMLCDGATIPGGNELSGNTPIMNNDMFIMGSSIAGTFGGTNNEALALSSIPNHRHADGTYTTSIVGGPFASSGHYHILGSNFIIPMHNLLEGSPLKSWIIYRYKFGSFWASERYMNFSTFKNAGDFTRTNNNRAQLKSGNTNGTNSTASLGGSNSAVGSTSLTGLSDTWDIRPNYITTQYVIKVSNASTLAEPSVSTEWASDPAALVLEPTTIHNTRGWDTDSGLSEGVPVKATIQHQNGWQRNVHDWLQYVKSTLGTSTDLFTGSIMAFDSSIAGSYPIPATSVVTDGWIVCDGGPIPGGHSITGNTPDLTNDIFIMGSSIAGDIGGSNTTSLPNPGIIPSHSHTDGSYASTRGGTFSSSTHKHALSSTNIVIPWQAQTEQFPDRISFMYHFPSPVWTANYYIQISFAGGSLYSNGNRSLEIWGNSNNSTASTGIGGSNTVTGTSSSSGSGSVFDIIPSYLSVQYLMFVGNINTRPIVTTKWAGSGTALLSQPTATNRARGWDTTDGTTDGAPEKPQLPVLNAWRKNVNEWILALADSTDRITLIPQGSIISIDDSISGAYTLPLPGLVKDGWMICDGTAIPGGQLLSGDTPKIDDDKFLLGSAVGGDTGGSNTVTLTTDNMPTHDHGAGSMSTSLSGSFANPSHTHGMGADVWIPLNLDTSGDYPLRWRSATNTPAWPSGGGGSNENAGHGFGNTSTSKTTYLDVSGSTNNVTGTASLSGSSNIGGFSEYYGSGSSFDSRPSYIRNKYLIKVI